MPLIECYLSLNINRYDPKSQFTNISIQIDSPKAMLNIAFDENHGFYLHHKAIQSSSKSPRSGVDEKWAPRIKEMKPLIF